jgi:hypothetical protein
MDVLVSFLTSMLALSIGVERIVEILKAMIPWLRKEHANEAEAARRRYILQMLAASTGALTAAIIGPHNFLPTVIKENEATPHVVMSCVLLGLMASGGSAVWNHMLDIVATIKATRERVVAEGDKVRAAHPEEVRRLNIPVGP